MKLLAEMAPIKVWGHFFANNICEQVTRNKNVC